MMAHPARVERWASRLRQMVLGPQQALQTICAICLQYVPHDLCTPWLGETGYKTCIDLAFPSLAVLFASVARYSQSLSGGSPSALSSRHSSPSQPRTPSHATWSYPSSAMWSPEASSSRVTLLRTPRSPSVSLLPGMTCLLLRRRFSSSVIRRVRHTASTSRRTKSVPSCSCYIFRLSNLVRLRRMWSLPMSLHGPNCRGAWDWGRHDGHHKSKLVLAPSIAVKSRRPFAAGFWEMPDIDSADICYWIESCFHPSSTSPSRQSQTAKNVRRCISAKVLDLSATFKWVIHAPEMISEVSVE